MKKRLRNDAGEVVVARREHSEWAATWQAQRGSDPDNPVKDERAERCCLARCGLGWWWAEVQEESMTLERLVRDRTRAMPLQHCNEARLN